MFRIALKDIRLFISDRRALLMTFFMPIALISIFAMAFGGEAERDARPVKLIISDLDQSVSSANIIRQLDSLKNLDVKILSLDSAERLVKTGEESAVLVFDKGFGDSLQSGKRGSIEMRFDQLKVAETSILQQALMGNLMRMIGEEKGRVFAANNPAMSDSLMKSLIAEGIARKQQEEKDVPVNMEMIPLIQEKQNSPGLIQAVAGTAVMMLLFGLVAMGAGLLEEKENGTLKRLLYSPIRPANILFGKMLASNVVALMQLSVLFGYAAFAFHLDLTKNVPALILMMLSTSFACSGFGMFLASISKSRQQVQTLSSLLVLSMSAIGGSMIPTFLMPAFMQKISVCSINYWSIQGFYDIYWRNLSFTDPAFLMRPLMLFAIGTVMLLIGLFFFRKNVLKLA